MLFGTRVGFLYPISECLLQIRTTPLPTQLLTNVHLGSQ